MRHANAQSRTPPHRASILLLGPQSRFQQTLAAELHTFCETVARADSLADATRRASLLENQPPRVLLLREKSIRVESFEEELAELMVRASASSLVPIAIGRKPDDARRESLRRAGVHLALFGRFGRHALRFQINRALSVHPRRTPRGDLRAPMEWRTRTYVSGREKTARCYSLSTGGGYFVTPRPWIVGSDVSLELPIDGARKKIQGRILYTKGPTESDRSLLPGGMAVSFRPLPQPLHDAIRRDLTRLQLCLVV